MEAKGSQWQEYHSDVGSEEALGKDVRRRIPMRRDNTR